MSKKIALENGSLDAVEGSGGSRTFKISATRKYKSKRYERVSIELMTCRHVITQLLNEIKEIHKRDRARMAEMTARIEREVKGLL